MYFNKPVTSAYKEFQKNFRGSWEDWTLRIFEQKNAMTRLPVYSMIVADTPVVGKANGYIIQLALRRRIPVLYYDKAEEMWHTVDDINNNPDSEDWTDLYRISYD